MRLSLVPALIAATAALAATAAAATVAAAPPAAVFGPPTVCHPIDIGNATSLPWGSDRFATDPAYDVARAVEDTLAILRASPDTLVHMETLRRAVIYLTPLSETGAAKPAAWREQELGKLLAALQADIAKCESAKSPAAEQGLREFDLGYAQAVLHQSERHGGSSSRAALARESEGWLTKASARRPDDGALHLGVALATFDGPAEASKTCYAHLERAVALATDPDGLLRRNLMKTMGSFLDASSYDDLAAKVGARSKRA